MINDRLTLGLSVGGAETGQTKMVNLFSNEYSPLDDLNIVPLGEGLFCTVGIWKYPSQLMKGDEI